jgi:hypothetical protein
MLGAQCSGVSATPIWSPVCRIPYHAPSLELHSLPGLSQATEEPCVPLPSVNVVHHGLKPRSMIPVISHSGQEEASVDHLVEQGVLQVPQGPEFQKRL